MVSRLACPPAVVTAVALNSAPVSASGRADAAVGGEDCRHQGADLAQAGGRQLARVGAQLAGLVPVDQLQRQRDVAAVLVEGGGLRAVADRQLGVLGAFGHGRQVPTVPDQGAGDGVEAC